VNSRPRIVVLDDDPTGTQSVSGLPIILRCDPRTLSEQIAKTDGPLWVLTNTRAMKVSAAVSELTRIVSLVRSMLGPDVTLVLRGDSTLRGHVLEEIDVLSEPDSVALFVPAFIEQGRITLGSIHYCQDRGTRVPVAETEYANDSSFAYSTSHLGAWVAQRQPGRPTVLIPASRLRNLGGSAVRDALVRSAPGTIVIPDAETLADIRAIHEGWMLARAAGRPVVLRSSSTLAGVAVGSAPAAAVLEPCAGAVLVVCGSHTTGADSQLARLCERSGVHHFEMPLLDQSTDSHARAAAELDESLASNRVTVLSTPRYVPDGLGDIASGQRIMDSLVDTVARLRQPIGALVTKGGITSARVPRDGLGARSAMVLGQSLPGIPVWRLHRDHAPDLIQVVVPGNVGGPDALAATVDRLLAPGAGGQCDQPAS
jgi:uncharacterized protein YgbK (DUF1537 family)